MSDNNWVGLWRGSHVQLTDVSHFTRHTVKTLSSEKPLIKYHLKPATCIHVERDVLNNHVRQRDDSADDRDAVHA